MRTSSRSISGASSNRFPAPRSRTDFLGELGDVLRQGKDRSGKIRGLGEAERFRNAELFLLLDRMDGQLGEFEKKLTSAFGSGPADYEAVKVLNNMLQLEDRGGLDSQ